MSDVKLIRYTLANNANLIAVVPPARILAGVVPLGTVFPAIAVNHISTVRRNTVAMNTATVLATSRVQVTVMAKTYDKQKSILELVRKALPNASGVINGVTVDSILPDISGPDLRDDDAGLYMQSMDFMCKITETT